jgi:hypothetical protein
LPATQTEQNLLIALQLCARWGEASWAPHRQVDPAKVPPNAAKIWAALIQAGLLQLKAEAMSLDPAGALYTGYQYGVILPHTVQGRGAVPVLCVQWSPVEGGQRTVRLYLFELAADDRIVATGVHFDGPNADQDFAYHHAQLCERHFGKYEELLGDQSDCHDELPRIPLPDWVKTPASVLFVVLRSIYGKERSNKWRAELTSKIYGEDQSFWEA